LDPLEINRLIEPEWVARWASGVVGRDQRRKEPMSVVTILIIIVLVLLALYLLRRVV
jgi:uncharacterized protein HemY